MKTKLVLFIVAAIACFAALVQAQDYDIVILNGRVMDPETEFDGVRNVGIKDGRIAVITEDNITGSRTFVILGSVIKSPRVALGGSRTLIVSSRRTRVPGRFGIGS